MKESILSFRKSFSDKTRKKEEYYTIHENDQKDATV